MEEQRQSRIILFYSCDPSDDILRDKLARFLRPLVREARIEEWSAQQIPAGADFAQERKRALEAATHILLLLSAEYLASDVCYQEMLSALGRQNSDGVSVIPIRLRPCLLPKHLEESLSCLPDNGQSVSTSKERDEAFRDVAQDICRILGLPLASLRRRFTDRGYLLDQVFTCWIEGVLEPSLQGRLPLDLPLQEQPDVLANPDRLTNPWRDEVQELKRVPRPLSSGTNIVQVYDDAKSELLILGEPGAGKTTLLLELAYTLLKRAEKEDGDRMPVVFPLSSWAKEKQPLGTWFVEELLRRHQIPRKISRRWIASNAILPLLDGLDEVDEPARAACVQAIEEYQAEVQRELVVCCRREEYLALPNRLTLQRAVCIQQLTDDQIECYLQQAERSTGRQLQGLRQALSDDKELNGLARQPLILSIFTLTYQGMAVPELPTATTQEQTLHSIFERYVTCMFTRRASMQRWTPEKFLSWLSFLAKQLYRQRGTVFLVEDLQPDWLSAERQRMYWWRLVLGVGLVLGLIFGVVILPAIDLLTVIVGGTFLSSMMSGLVGILLGGLAPGLLIGTVLWFFVRKGRGRTLLAEGFFWLQKKRWHKVVGGMTLGLFIWYVINGKLIDSLLLGLPVGMTIALLFLFPFQDGGSGRILPAEVVSWSWNAVWSIPLPIIRIGLIFGLFCGAIGELFNWLFHGSVAWLMIPQFVVFGLAATVIAGLLGLPVFALSTNQLTTQDHLSPNEGIRRSRKNGLIVGSVAGLVYGPGLGLGIGLIYALVGGAMDGITGRLVSGITNGLDVGLIIGVFVAVIAGLFGGLNAFVQHFLVRFWLWHQDCLPRDLIAFLDEAVERLLLHKVGGSYIFIHPLLLEYFATLGEPKPAESTSLEERLSKDMQQ